VVGLAIANRGNGAGIEATVAGGRPIPLSRRART
jgi:hypothetical protein